MIDVRRLQREIAAAYRLDSHTRPVRFAGGTGDSWQDFGVMAEILGRTVIGRFNKNHPYAPPRFTIDRPPRSRHYYDDGQGWHLCWCGAQEWNSDWTIATGLGAVHRFLGLFDRGKVD